MMQWIWMLTRKATVSSVPNLYVYCPTENSHFLNVLFTEGVLRLKDKVVKRKGRGFGPGEGREHEKVRGYESVETGDYGDEPGPQKCKFTYGYGGVRCADTVCTILFLILGYFK